MINPEEMKRIVDFVHSSKAKDLHEAAIREFLPDVTQYKGKMFVTIDIDLRGGEAHAAFLTDEKEWTRITKGTWDEAFNLGEVCGKYSSVKVGYHDIFWGVAKEKDPYAIARLVAEHGAEKPLWIEDYLAEYESEAEEEKETAN